MTILLIQHIISLYFHKSFKFYLRIFFFTGSLTFEKVLILKKILSENFKSKLKRKNAAKNLFKYDINRERGLEVLESFLVKTYFLKSESFADYCSGNIRTKRRIMFTFIEYYVVNLHYVNNL